MYDTTHSNVLHVSFNSQVADVFALGAPREGSRAEIKNVPVEKLTGPTELFQLSRTDFEDIMQQFPIVRFCFFNVTHALIFWEQFRVLANEILCNSTLLRDFVF